MAFQFANNASTTLASSVLPTDLEVTVASAALFPVPTPQDPFLCTLANQGDTYREITLVTGIQGNVLTVQRGQEGTAPRAFQIGDTAGLLLTAGALASLAPQAYVDAQDAALQALLEGQLETTNEDVVAKSGDTMEGPLEVPALFENGPVRKKISVFSSDVTLDPTSNVILLQGPNPIQVFLPPAASVLGNTIYMKTVDGCVATVIPASGEAIDFLPEPFALLASNHIILIASAFGWLIF
jgi:hypothetical protein